MDLTRALFTLAQRPGPAQTDAQRVEAVKTVLKSIVDLQNKVDILIVYADPETRDRIAELNPY
jgi:hypothetical protein